MLSSRWRKVLRDLWQNKGRSLLVILSIAVGVFAVGTVVHMQVIVRQDMIGSYVGANPANATIYTEGYFDENVVEIVREMPEVAQAEGRSSVVVQFQLDEEAGWFPLILFAIPDYENMGINVLYEEAEFGPEPDAWPGPVPLPPPYREVMFERTSCILSQHGLAFQAKRGNTMLVETPMGKQREMRMAGLVGDFSRLPATNWWAAYGYVTFETMEWLGLPSDYNELVLLVSGDRGDKAHIEDVAKKVADRMERSGMTVVRTEVPEPGVLPLDYMVNGLVLILTALGILSLFSSIFLLINTVQALLAQQVQQIGVMKAIGARGHQLLGMYLSIIVVYGILALLIAVPLGTWIARWIVNFTIYFINFNLSEFGFPPQVLAIEIAMGLLVPLLAALWPIIAGTRITVREAISDYGMGEGGFGTGLIDRLIEQVRGLPRPLLLSLRNTFRHKGRLVLTLLTLVLAGAIFIAIVSVRASMTGTVNEIFQFYKADIELGFNRPYRVDRIEGVALGIPGVVAVESWGSTGAYRLRPDDTEGKSFAIEAPPATTQMIAPTMIEGRWLLPEDDNAIVLSSFIIQDEPDIRVGDEVVLDIEGRETTWRVVGIMRPPIAASIAYADYSYVARLTRDTGRASSLRVVTEQHDGDFQTLVAEAMKERFDLEGMSVGFVSTVEESRAGIAVLFDILITLLMSMAVLLGTVGGVGLMGTMLLNVLERMREIGVMRAIGASSEAILQIFIVEGVLIGIISWLLGTILALPLGRLLSDAMGAQLPFGSLSYTFSLSGVGIWFVLAILLSIAASYFPAQNAARLTVREVLSYQ